MAQYKILVVDDNADIREVLRVIEMTTDVKLSLDDRTIYIE